MKPSPFTYHDPQSVAETAAILSEVEDCRLLAGGQSLMPMMNFRFVQPSNLVDLNGVRELAFVREDAGRIAFGAMTRQRTLERSAGLRESCPIIPLALSHVGHRQTRARGTIGGSLCHFDPSAELCNLAALHEAELVLARRGGERALPFAEFGVGYLTTAVEPDEFLREVRFRRWPQGHGYAFEEFAMRHGDFAICAISCLVTLAPSGAVDDIAIAVSGVGAVPFRLGEAEASARGERPGHDLYRALATAASKVEAMSDSYVSAGYRQHLARILTYRAVKSAVENAGMRAAA
ncbi:FAD binding domain-containing protein [Propylenella binzhouense]|uniref:Xanthine dehydrogenase family protein subunit M n=1 Tax=Propylenella binzhouense TaxID=2555902 RepID=A0A964T689_9HYPH|nr:FAD binding domain-containing protein [Propylenella binzhouense]MYZ48584.1 xanthine dehydrogenase family protein subunit M [Propylenella binzhouense]